MYHKTQFELMIERQARVRAWKRLVDQICQVKKVKCNNCKQLTPAYYQEGSVYCNSCESRISKHE